MKIINGEISARFQGFENNLATSRADAEQSMLGTPAYLQSYHNLCTLQAWRVNVVEMHGKDEATAFFLEAQNDCLASHALAAVGMWRPALASLRGCLENALAYLYYKDHQIELELWQSGQFNIASAKLREYVESHPSIKKSPIASRSAACLRNEYQTLSKAVHASGRSFRMTEHGTIPSLFKGDKAMLSQWLTRQRQVVRIVNIMFLAVFRAEVVGTRNSELRKTISFILTESQRKQIKAELNITLFAP